MKKTLTFIFLLLLISAFNAMGFSPVRQPHEDGSIHILCANNEIPENFPLFVATEYQVAEDGGSTGINWAYYNENQIPYGAAISEDGQRIFGAIGWAPASALLFDTGGNGTPMWVKPIDPHSIDGEFTISDDRSVKVHCFVNLSEERCGLIKWSGDNANPDWYYVFPGRMVSIRGGVSADGSVIFVCASSPGTIYSAMFDPASSTPVWSNEKYVGVADIQAAKLSYNGRRVLCSDMGGGIWVIDTVTKNILWNEAVSALAYGYDISDNGNVIAVAAGAFPARVDVREWDGTTYKKLWSYRPGGMSDYLYDAVSVSGDGNTIVIGCAEWFSRGHNILNVFDKSSGTPLWSKEIMGGPGGGPLLWDAIEYVDLNTDGSRFIVGYWGDPEYPHEEVFVFEREDPDPIFVLDTPGSVFGADITDDGTAASVNCKRIHASQQGFGGYIYSLSLESFLALEVTRYPLDPVTPGQSYDFTFRLENKGQYAQYIDELDLKAHQGPASGSVPLYKGDEKKIAPGAVLVKTFKITIPRIMPPGTYEMAAVVRLDGGRLARDYFPLVVK